MLAISKPEAPYAGVSLVREACTGESLAHFGWDLFTAWRHAGADAKESWAFTALGLIGDENTVRALAAMIREWCSVSAAEHAVTGVDVLATLGSDLALQHLQSLAINGELAVVQERAADKLRAIAEARGSTYEELLDRWVPSLGLDAQGSLQLDFGPRQFMAALDDTLRPCIWDSCHARLPDLPEPLPSDTAALAAAATVRYRQLQQDADAIASLQVLRFEHAMSERRRWTAPQFRRLLHHPLLRQLAARLIWGVYVDDVLRTAFRITEDWTFADSSDCAYVLAANARVGIAHALDLPTELQAAFGRLFGEYEILQPFRQLGREVFTASAAELQEPGIQRFRDRLVVSTSIMGLLQAGWSREAKPPGAHITSISKRRGSLQFELHFKPGIVINKVEPQPQRLVVLALSPQRGGPHLTFAQLDAITLSEVLRDIELLAAV